jgi:N-acyl-D-aspartate/D-glutamate deacylase
MYDIVIRGGTVVDGTGAPPTTADVAISGDRIVEVGEVTEEGRQELDATDRYVTPGFVDIHTHLDAQLFWDPVASPSSWHGVTSVVLGNCGVTFAPVRPGQERYLAELMEAVEDIPADTIMEGVDWGWETYGGYLASLRQKQLGVNVGGMIGHCALRYYVMGERSFDEAPATDADLEQMQALVDEAMAGGALGFSTSRTYMHTVPDGRPVPGTFADLREMQTVAQVLAAQGKGTIEVVPRIGERDGPERENSVAELSLLEEVSRASGRPLTFAITQSDRRPDLWSWVMDQVAAARARGADLRPQTSARGSGILYGLVNRTPYDSLPEWADLMSRPFSQRLDAIKDESFRRKLVDAAAAPSEERGPLAPKDPAKLYLLPPGPAVYDVREDNSLAREAERRGTTPAGAFLDVMLSTGGLGLLYYPVLNQDLDAVASMLCNEDVLVGVADAGAHVALTMDAGQSTYLLSHWVRDQGLFDISRAVHKLTQEGADLFGLAGRGVLAVGAYADVNVLDLGGMQLQAPEMCSDLPLGAPRFVQRSRGYDYTLVNGRVLVDHDELTNEHAGHVLSSV